MLSRIVVVLRRAAADGAHRVTASDWYYPISQLAGVDQTCSKLHRQEPLSASPAALDGV